jgi:competence protein ComEC
LWVSAVFLSVVALRSRDAAALTAVLLLGLSCGWWRGAAQLQQLSVYNSLQYRKVTITARATDDALYGRSKQLTFDAGSVVLDDGTRLPGKIQLSGFGANAVFQGDTVQATGKLYPGYGSYKGSINYAELRVMERSPTLLSVLRQKFTAGMQTALPEPLAPFAMGLLVGQRATLPDGVKQDLLRVGLTHIIAVSGYNLTIILHASRRLMGRRSKRMATLMSMGLIGTFLLLAGTSASIVRAAIVSLLSMAAGYYGREFKPLNLILLAAAITAWANPSYVWGDLSWYLSFLAFFGVMVVSPLVQARYPGRWHGSLIGAVALESICAEAMSVPLILFVFGQMSLIGLPANVLVVALIPLAMLLGLIAGLAGMLLGPLAGWFAWPAALLLNYMLDTAHLLAGLPHVFVQNRSLTLAGMLGLYAVVAGLTIVLHVKTKQSKPAIITDKNQSALEGAAT